MSDALSRWHKITLMSYVGLFAVIVYWYFVAAPIQTRLGYLFIIVYLTILLIPARSLFSRQPRVYMWSSYLILLYFSHATIEVYANQAQRYYALAELLLSISYFISATVCTRLVRQQKAS